MHGAKKDALSASHGFTTKVEAGTADFLFSQHGSIANIDLLRIFR
jgi:hypothetical protein